jgi:hypothetical protein
MLIAAYKNVIVKTIHTEMEELHMRDEFGDDYADYMFSTGRGREFLYGKNGGGGGGRDGCYIATAVYGSYDCPQVWVLRRFRDFKLKSTAPGRAFVRAYYALSPSAAAHLRANGPVSSVLRRMLDGFVRTLRSRGYSDRPYSDAPNIF